MRHIIFRLPVAIEITGKLVKLRLATGRLALLTTAGAVTITGDDVADGLQPDKADCEADDPAAALALAVQSGAMVLSGKCLSRRLLPDRITDTMSDADHLHVRLASARTLVMRLTCARTLIAGVLHKRLLPDKADVAEIIDKGIRYQHDGQSWQPVTRELGNS